MALVINTNVASLNAQRQLNSSGADLDQATERLSSGQRINSAKDDAAGLAISNRFTSQIRGLDQAIRNANDGISLIQTAEGALQEGTNILQRIRELSVQSANGIFTDGDRQTLNAEAQQLKDELNRIAETTSFNGKTLLDGSLGETLLQIGDQANQTLGVNIGSLNTRDLGGTSGDIVGEAVTGLSSLGALADGNLLINGTEISSLTAFAAAGSTIALNDVLSSINADLEGENVEVGAQVNLEATSVGSGVLTTGTDRLDITVVDGDNNTQTFQITGTNSLEELVNKINEDTTVTASINDEGRLELSGEGVETISVANGSGAAAVAAGFVAAGDSAEFSLTFNSTNGTDQDIQITQSSAGAVDVDALGINVNDAEGNLVGQAIAAGSTTTDLAEGDLVINGVEIGAIAATDGTAGATIEANRDAVITAINEFSEETGVVAFAGGTGTSSSIELRSTTGDQISIEAGNSATASNITAVTGFQERNAAGNQGSVSSIDISTAAGAQRAIEISDVAINQISDIRADLGAVNNRLDFTTSNLANVSEKTSAARSRILDADFAAETANLSRAQVLQQAASAMLAQANARPQQALQLLN